MSRQGRRILRPADGMAPAAASFLVHVPPAGRHENRGDLNGMLDHARQQGWDEGYRAATEEMAVAETAGRAAQLRRVADALVAAAEDARMARIEAVQIGGAEAAELAYRLAEAFLQRELHIGDAVLDAVVRALQLVPDEQDLVVRLHPGDSVDTDELRRMVPDAAIRVVADPRVEVGGCVVTAGPCRIDTQMGPALERVRQALDEVYPQTDPEEVMA